MSYALGAAVEFDLDDIWEYIAADSIDAANRWIEKLFEAFDSLEKTPTMGHRREDRRHFQFCSGPLAGT